MTLKFFKFKSILCAVAVFVCVATIPSVNAMPATSSEVLAATLKLPEFHEEMEWFSNGEINRIEIRKLQSSETLIYTDPRAFCASAGGNSRSATIIALIGWRDAYQKPSEIKEVRLFATAGNPEHVKLCSGE